MRICIVKATKQIIEMQSHATEGMLIQNAVNGGYALADIEEREVDEAGYEAAKAICPTEIANKEAQVAQAIEVEKKQQDIVAAKEAIASMSTEVDKATDVEGLKKVVNELIKHVQILTG